MQEKEAQKPNIPAELQELLTKLKDSGELESYLPQAQEPTLCELLARDFKGNIKQTNENCQLVLQRDETLKDVICFNEFTGQIDVVKQMPWKQSGNAFSDNDLDNIITYMEINYGLHVDKQIERAIRVVAKQNSYHPIRDKLNALVWDGEERLQYVLTKYLGVPASPLATESLKVFMLGAIERVFHPGCKFEYMLCLVGGQGAGKSTFLRFLAMEDAWFTDDIRKLNDKGIHERLSGHWFVEFAEMVALLHAKFIEETKSFITGPSQTMCLCRNL